MTDTETTPTGHERELSFERHMSDQEALMWNIEKDPWLNPSGAALTILDQPPDRDLLVAKIRHGLSRIPRLRERVVPGLGRMSPPVWATDREFDLAYHVRHLALPQPGSMRQLLDLVTRLHEEPYDRTRPLWMFYVIEGLEGGRGALFAKQHHSVADGIGSLRMAEVYTDLERTPAPPPEVDLDAVFTEAIDAERDELVRAGADMSDSIIDTATRTLTHNLRRQGGIVSRTLGALGGAATDPVKAVSGVVEQLRSTVETVSGGGLDAPAVSAPLFTNRSRRRHLEVLKISLADAKAAAKALGGSVNDLFVTGAAMAAFAYHDQRGTPAAGVAMSFVVSTRTDSAMGGNAFTPVPVMVPAAGVTTPAERFVQLRDLMAERRAAVRSGHNPMAAVAGLANLLPTSVTTRIARQQAGKLDIATSNLRGAPMPTFMAGGAVESGFPMGPLAGTAANLTVISQNGWMDMGLLMDPAAIDEPGELAGLLEQAYADLIAAGAASSVTRRSSTKRRTS